MDPEYYDGEYAEGRIRSIEYRLATDRVLASADLGSLLRDADPVVVSLALEALDKDWKPEALDDVLRLLRDDDVTLRWNAMRLIADHGGPPIDVRLPELLADSDPRARGIALYIAAKRGTEKALPALRQSLKSDSELIRFDALSALVMYCGPAGKGALQEYALSGKEPSPAIRERIQKILREPGTEDPPDGASAPPD
jgi:hypothetical protein